MPRQRKTSFHQERARELRHDATQPEQRLWQVLRNRRLAGLKFRRQVPIEQFIVDFVCVERRLIVEVDGDSHVGRNEADRRREQRLSDAGWSIVRVANDDVFEHLEGALMSIVCGAGLDPVAWRDGAYGQLPEGTF